MLQTLARNWWLITLCGILEAIIAIIFLLMQSTAGPLPAHSWGQTILFLGRLAAAAGVCTIAAGLWRSAKGRSWLLVLNGLAFIALGLLFNAVHFRISIRTFALVFVIMAVSIGMFQLAIARNLHRRRADEWFFGVAGAASVCFAAAFVALAFRWIRLEPGTHPDLLLFGAYFTVTAVCMLVLGLRLHSWRALQL